MSNEDRDYTYANQTLIDRERDKQERLKAKVESLRENLTADLAAMLKQIDVKKSLIPEVLKAEDKFGEKLGEIRKAAGGGNDTWGG